MNDNTQMRLGIGCLVILIVCFVLLVWVFEVLSVWRWICWVVGGVSLFFAVDLLKKWLKILKPGGKLIMELPNIEDLCKAFVTASKLERYGILNCVYGTVNTKEAGEQSDITSPHLWGWYPEMMYDHLRWAGFEDITFGPEQIPHPHSNFRVEAKKPQEVLV